jgi:hypothetical protein
MFETAGGAVTSELESTWHVVAVIASAPHSRERVVEGHAGCPEGVEGFVYRNRAILGGCRNDDCCGEAARKQGQAGNTHGGIIVKLERQG